jgi:long-chain fatty acid transport protein
VKSTIAFTSLVGLATAAAPAFAAGGYYAGALGARAAGRAGAFAARADDPTAVSYNPAGLAKSVDGDADGPPDTVIMLGNRLSYNAYAYTRAPTPDWGHVQNGVAPTVAFDEVRNGQPWQPLEPLLAVASKLGLRDWGFALAAFAAPGTSREAFPPGGGQRYLMVSREAIILDYAASAAWKHRELFGVGATLEWIHVPRLDYALVIDGTPFAGVANPVSSPLDLLASTTGSDAFTFNAIVGAWLRPAPFLEFALAGQVVPANIVAKSRLSVAALDPSMGPVALTRDGRPANDVTVTLPLPLLARAGARYRRLAGRRAGVGGSVRELFDVELDVEYESWSRVQQFTLDTHGLAASLNGADVDLGKIAVRKRWRDTVAVRLGGDYAVIPGRWTLRAGGFYETAVADAAYANVDFPGGAMLGGSLGTSLVLGRWEVAIAYQLRRQPRFGVSEGNARVYQQVPASACQPPYQDATACNPNYLGQPSPAVNAGSYGATSHSLTVALLYRYSS